MAYVHHEPNTGCWLWSGHTNKTGYGKFGVVRAPVLAHRYSYELHVGPIPPSMFVCHRCDVPSCVNPAHLFIGTAADNVRDKVLKGRQSRGEAVAACQRGERGSNAKLTAEQVKRIRELAASGETQQMIANLIGINRATVSRIVHRRTWTEVTP